MTEFICDICGKPLPKKEGSFRLIMRSNDSADLKYRATVCNDCHLILKRLVFLPGVFGMNGGAE